MPPAVELACSRCSLFFIEKHKSFIFDLCEVKGVLLERDLFVNLYYRERKKGVSPLILRDFFHLAYGGKELIKGESKEPCSRRRIWDVTKRL